MRLFINLFYFCQAASYKKPDPENAKSWPRFVLRVDRHMCNYLTSGKRTKLAVLSSSLKVWILLKVSHEKYHLSIIFSTCRSSVKMNERPLPVRSQHLLKFIEITQTSCIHTIKTDMSRHMKKFFRKIVQLDFVILDTT